jgi:hypothetical protein
MMTQILITDLQSIQPDHSFHKNGMISATVGNTLDIQKIIGGVAEGGCIPGSDPIFPEPIFPSLP